MPSDDPAQRFQDILGNLARVEDYTAGMKLEDVAEILCPDIPWRRVRGLGNFMRHEYDRIERDLVWSMIERDVPVLKIAVRRALEELLKRETGSTGANCGTDSI